ncbi:MAG TPA: Gfo/Idh/MocA family oxidoreductase [Planctomycetota bacterium]|nr:Gfo/Idh/MocA family oxidoreductase [Planctomycetota bacterium]
MGVIGLGSRASQVVRMVERLDPDARIAAVTDPDKPGVLKRLENTRNLRDNLADIRFYTEPDEMLDKEDLTGVVIGTRCSLHARLACKVAARGLPLYLEKPIATTMDDLKMLKKAFDASSSEVVVSFPLRLSPMVLRSKEIFASGRIGTLEQVQAINNVSYGAGYYRNWYRDYNETGGLWLQKATHDLDYINAIVGETPVLIAAMHSQRVMGKRKPAGLTCDVCDELETCPESPYADFHKHGHVDHYEPAKRKCTFGEDIDPRYQDNGSALVEYANGLQAVYSQNFFVRRHAGYRGATLIGYHGTIQFDWNQPMFRLTMHHKAWTETVDCASDGHGGGDVELARDFIGVMRGTGKSRAPISAGILSAYMCLKARESALNRRFEKLDLAELDR